ncbi:MAG: hypothetical protein EXR77_09025 [Myxococcales bacterium]|nr:hypothetical protein [Myxococcales bacterium]
MTCRWGGLVDGSPFSFVVKYCEQTQVGTGEHHDFKGYATLTIVLNNAFVGGGTYFPAQNCTVHARKGDAVLFSGRRDLHRAMPVEQGTRYVVTVWVHAPNVDEMFEGVESDS